MRRLFSLCNLLIFIALCAFLFVPGCAFTQPQKLVMDLAGQNTGFIVAQEMPDVAKDVLEYSDTVLAIGPEKFTEANFHDWAEIVMEKFKLHPFLVMNFKQMIKAVNIEIKLSESQTETTQLVFNVIQNFTIGLKVGLKAK